MAHIRTTSKRRKARRVQILTPLDIDTKKKQNTVVLKRTVSNIIDYKDADFLMYLVNEQGKILPRTFNRNILKYQRKVAQSY